MAKGEFIAFLDADDCWESNKLEHQIPCFDDPAIAVVYSDYAYIDKSGAYSLNQPGAIARPSGVITEQLLLRNFIPFSSSVVRRYCFEKENGFDESLEMGIDWHLWLRLSVDWQFQCVNSRLLRYRVWDGQMSTNIIGRYTFAFRILDEFVARYSKSLPSSVINRAYADTHSHRGNFRSILHRDWRGAIKDAVRAIRYSPSYIYSWKILLKILGRSLADLVRR